MNKKKYQEYLKSDHWKKIRSHWWRSNLPKKCLRCGAGHYELHHIKYNNLGKENIYKDLIPLCSKCHESIHQQLKKQRRNLLNTLQAIFRRK